MIGLDYGENLYLECKYPRIPARLTCRAIIARLQVLGQRHSCRTELNLKIIREKLARPSMALAKPLPTTPVFELAGLSSSGEERLPHRGLIK